MPGRPTRHPQRAQETCEHAIPASRGAYCHASGVIATTAATALSSTVSGAASFAVWIFVLVVVCALAGLGYDSALVRCAARYSSSRRTSGNPGGAVRKEAGR